MALSAMQSWFSRSPPRMSEFFSGDIPRDGLPLAHNDQSEDLMRTKRNILDTVALV